MREKDVEQALTQAVKKAGGISLKLVSPGTAGIPDRLILLRGGKAGFIEVKAPGQKPRALQMARLHQLQHQGFTATWIDHPAQIQDVLHAIQTS
ncbi:nuclease [Corynebacterium striatum]|nr:nuclease [Corynebacterium striatum]